MYRKLLSVSLISVISLSLVVPGFAADPKPKAASSAKVQTLQLSGMEFRGEEIDYKVQRDGKHGISLRGRAGLKLYELAVTADLIQATYSNVETMVLKLKGKVVIASKDGKLKVKASEATFDFEAKSLFLEAVKGKRVMLTKINGSNSTVIEAAQIQLQFQDQGTMLLNTFGSLTLKEGAVKLEQNRAQNRLQDAAQFGPNKDVFGDPTGFNAPYPAAR